ncbi:MAG: hypothetical protein HQK79_16400 [Desulfobacterales bacterium]|nr:hypothetical protein [Desulfobacterales bacterium]MBF0397137.1 hypothetical protein [Desulfobacterales bacterium]
MRVIKKYANRKLYDTIDKKYISLERLSELVREGEDISVVDNITGEDLTSSIMSQVLVRDNKESKTEVPSSILVQLIRKGGGTVIDYAKKYASLWQSAVTMADDEIEKIVNLLIKNKEISEVEGNTLKEEVLGYADNLKNWIAEKIDQRVSEVSKMMNLATKEHINHLNEIIESLSDKVKDLEKSIGDKKSK